MSRSVLVRLFLVGFLHHCLFTGCSRDPNVRKQKFLESGDRYFSQGKYREAAIQYSNALPDRLPLRPCHYQLGKLISSSATVPALFKSFRAPWTWLLTTIAPTSTWPISWSRRAIPMALPMQTT